MRKPTRNRVILALVIFALGAWLSRGTAIHTPVSPVTAAGIGTYPTMWAKGIVLASVKAPKTATFDAITQRRQDDDPKHWGVTGKVTSQNSFGALLTDDFWVSLHQLCDRYDDAACWQPDAVRIGDAMVLGSNQTLQAMKF